MLNNIIIAYILLYCFYLILSLPQIWCQKDQTIGMKMSYASKSSRLNFHRKYFKTDVLYLNKSCICLYLIFILFNLFKKTVATHGDTYAHKWHNGKSNLITIQY